MDVLRCHLSAAVVDPSAVVAGCIGDRLLLERDAELEMLAAAVVAAAEGNGRAFLVSGEAGIGKTALVRAFVERVESDARVLVGSCDDLITPRTLGPLRDAVRSSNGLLAEALAAPFDREALYGALYEELSNPLRPTVLVIEDVHWADDATLDVLRFVARRLEELRAVLVVTHRDDGNSRNEPLQGLIGTLVRGPHTRLPLRPLSSASIGALAAGAEVDVEALYRFTGGNAFFVTEVLANADATVPASVVEAVLGRIAGSSEAGRAALEQLSVIPSTVEHSLIDALLGGPRELAEMEAGGMIMSRADGVAFRHELARRAVQGSIPTTRRIELNRRVVAAMLASDHPEPDRIVHHAAEGHDDDRLLEFAPVAAREAAAAGAHRQAAGHLHRLIPHLNRFSLEERAALLESYGHECYLTSSGIPAVEAQRHAIALRRELGDRVATGDGLRRLSRTYWTNGRRRDAEEAIDAAIHELEGLTAGRHELAMAYSTRSQLAMLAYQNDAAIVWGEKAIALAEEIGDDETLSHALNNVGCSRWQQDDERGPELLRRSLELALRHGRDEHACRAYTNLIWHHLEAYDLDVSRRLLEESIPFAERTEMIGLLSYQYGERALLGLMTGDWEGAAQDAARNVEVRVSQVPALLVKATLEARRGHPQAAQTLESAHHVAEQTQELQRIGPVAVARAELAWLGGHGSSAAPAVRRALDLAHELAYRPLQASLAYWLWKIAGEPTDLVGDPPEGLQIRGEWRRAAERWAALGCPYHRALALSESGEAEATLLALTIFDDLGATATAAVVRQDLRRLGASAIPRGVQRNTRANPAGLTDRQLEVLTLMVDGQTNNEIAAGLVLSVRTVEHHVTAVLAKLGASNRHEAVTAARDLGITEPAP